MNFKTTLSLFALLIAMLFLFGMTLTLKHKEQDLGFVLPSIAKINNLGVDTVEIEKDGKKYVLYLEAKQWYLKLPEYRGRVRADEARVTSIINAVRTARKSNEPDVTRNLADFGLDKPELTFTLKKKDTSLDVSLYLGKISQDKGYVYANSSERPREVLAVPRSTLKDLYFQDINDLRSRQLLEVNENTAKLLNLKEHKDKKTHQLVLQRSEGATWNFLDPKYGPATFEGDLSPIKLGPREIKGVKDLLNTIGAIVVQEFEPPGRGVVISENNALLRIEIDSEGVVGNSKELLLIGPKISHKEKEQEQYYARLASDEDVVRVAASRIDPLLVVVEDPARLRSLDLAHLVQAKPDRIQIVTGSDLKENFSLYKTDSTNWQVVTGTNRMKANAEAIEQGLLAALEGKRQIKHFLDTQKTDAELGLDEKKPGSLGPIAVVKVFADSLEMPKDKDVKDKDKAKLEVQPKDVAPLVTLTFAKKDGDTVAVKRVMADKSVSRFVAAASVLDKVTQEPLAYLDTTLPGFLTVDVAKFELKRDLPDDRVDFIVKSEKSKEGNQVDWLLLQPKDLPNRPKADKTQVDEMLTLLNNLKAKKWVEKANSKKLPYGLDNPAISVTIQLEKPEGKKADPKPIIYKFGQEAKDKDKGSYYALIPGSGELGDLVFLVDASVFDKLKNAELRDRSVLKFNIDKVEEVKVKVVAAGSKLRPVFKRGEKGWIDSGSDVNDFLSQKVDNLLKQLSSLEAEKYVSFKAKGNEAAYGLGDQAPLTFDIIMKDKTQHTLTIGKELADKSGYYARINSMPEVVFTVSTAQFSPYLGSVSAFSRNK